MKPSQLLTLLTSASAARLPIAIVGKPGIGKTSIVKQASSSLGHDLVISHPGLWDPTDAKGFPWIKNGKADFVPFGDIRRVLESTKPTDWFLDDMGQAPAAVQAACMPWLLEREVYGNRLPDHVSIMMATNRRTDRAGVSGILEPVKSRFAAIVTLEEDIDEWCKWGLTCPDIQPEVIAYLRFQPEDLCQFEPSADLVNCPLPRTWHAASQLLQLHLPADVEAEALRGAIGEGAATKFMGYLQMYRQLPSIDLILEDPNSQAIPTQPSVLYAIATALAARATEKNFVNVGRYGQRLYDANWGDFAALILRDSSRRRPNIQKTPAFVKLVAGPLGELMGGGVQ